MCVAESRGGLRGRQPSPHHELTFPKIHSEAGAVVPSLSGYRDFRRDDKQRGWFSSGPSSRGARIAFGATTGDCGQLAIVYFLSPEGGAVNVTVTPSSGGRPFGPALTFVSAVRTSARGPGAVPTAVHRVVHTELLPAGPNTNATVVVTKLDGSDFTVLALAVT